MGYTHYLSSKTERGFDDSTFAIIAKKSAKLLLAWLREHPGAKLSPESGNLLLQAVLAKDADAISRVFIQERAIHIEFCEGCEPLHIEQLSIGRNPDYGYFAFCKTRQRKVYDALVVAAYSLIESETKGSFVFSSDGDANDMSEGFSFYRHVFDKPAGYVKHDVSSIYGKTSELKFNVGFSRSEEGDIVTGAISFFELGEEPKTKNTVNMSEVIDCQRLIAEEVDIIAKEPK